MRQQRPHFDVHVLDEDDLAEAAERHRDRMRKAAAAGETAGGTTLGTHQSGPRKGAPITLRQSGRLLESLAVKRRQGGADLEAQAPYARHVFERFPEAFAIEEEHTRADLHEMLERKKAR